MSERLNDEVAIITGAGSGIGTARARRFGAGRAHLVASEITDKAGAGAAGELAGARASHIAATTGEVNPRRNAEGSAGAA